MKANRFGLVGMLNSIRNVLVRVGIAGLSDVPVSFGSGQKVHVVESNDTRAKRVDVQTLVNAVPRSAAHLTRILG